MWILWQKSSEVYCRVALDIMSALSRNHENWQKWNICKNAHVTWRNFYRLICYIDHDTRLLWSKIGLLLEHRAPCQLHHSANDLANHFTSKVEKVRQSTSCASPPVISKRKSDTFSTLHSVTVEGAARLLTRSPAKHCPLDPVPTWLLKRAADQFAPVIAHLCNTSFPAGNLPLLQKHVLVSARLKKSTLDATDLSSYRPISQLPFASKLVERAAASCFVHHSDEHRLLPARQSAYLRYH